LKSLLRNELAFSVLSLEHEFCANLSNFFLSEGAPARTHGGLVRLWRRISLGALNIK
jgi:hypothetical protein